MVFCEYDTIGCQMELLTKDWDMAPGMYLVIAINPLGSNGSIEARFWRAIGI